LHAFVKLAAAGSVDYAVTECSVSAALPVSFPVTTTLFIVLYARQYQSFKKVNLNKTMPACLGNFVLACDLQNE